MSFGDWTRGYLLSTGPYLGGHFLERGFAQALTWSEPTGLILQETLAGTHKLWRPFSDTKAPRDMQGISASIDLYRVTEEDKRVLESLIRSGSPVLYADGRTETDLFPNSITGESKKLTRPIAAGTVAGVSESTHPTVVRLDGVVDAAAATVTGQNVSVLKTGSVEVRYTPVYTVIFLTLDWRIANYNDLLSNAIRMQEVIQGDFS